MYPQVSHSYFSRNSHSPTIDVTRFLLACWPDFTSLNYTSPDPLDLFPYSFLLLSFQPVHFTSRSSGQSSHYLHYTITILTNITTTTPTPNSATQPQ
jgi:hypothetical protein